MPVLAREPDLYPEGLLDSTVTETDRHWLVVRTRPRQEKSLSRELWRYQVPFYLPLVAKTLVYRGRKVVSYSPLFSGYVFLWASESERVRTLATNRVTQILAVAEPDRLFSELKQLRQLIAANAPLTVESRLGPGRRVRVRSGSFAGIEGTVMVRRRETRLLVIVDFLQRGASVEIDDFLLEPID